METLFRFLFTFLGVLALIILQVYGQDQKGFISLDCGSPASTSYTDAKTNLNYISDASFINTGVSKSVESEFDTNNIDRPLWSVRSFPQGVRNCYNVSLSKDTQYLIRATFLYGDYDEQNQPPQFDLHLGPNKWVTVTIPNESTPVIEEIIYNHTLKYTYICLVNTSSGTPFISALEIRPLKYGTYSTESGNGSLALFQRMDVGSLTNQTVRYPDDVYDRLWSPLYSNKWTDISTNQTFDSDIHNDFWPPSIVMRSAAVPTGISSPMEVPIYSEDSISKIYVYMHFAEIVKLEANQSRKFNISLNGDTWNGPVVPSYLNTSTVYRTSAISGGKYDFSLFKVDGSTLQPLLNAYEVYYVVDLSQSETNQADVDAILKIKSTYKIKSDWQGDPCAPHDFVWLGLDCSYNGTAPPVIKSLNLSGSELTGEISPDIANLKSLESLDLSNNSLIGPVPDFLSQLLSLKVLNLAGNMLNGSTPDDLYKRSESGLLSLSVVGNPQLCPLVSCKNEKKKKKFVVPVVGSVAALFVIVAAVAIWILKIRKQKTAASGMMEAAQTHKKQFTYSEVLQITYNFGRVLGRGGFGTVYHGYLDNIEVAVKMLSPSSVQGYKEFQAEVKLLLRVHHKSLTTLVGYCDEGKQMGLIYEYMANGNLNHHLSGDRPNILSWEGRLKIAHEAAQGLEYLHNGCKPPIVHRDVKSTNILLSDKFQAKLADFGQSRIFPLEGGSHVSTIVAGTPGYLDPEYYVTNWLTEKSDVFSFGVVLLEIITCRPVITKTGLDKSHLSLWVSSMLEKGDIKNVVDSRLRGDFDINSVWKVAELAMACVSETSDGRPTMNQVVMELNECLATEMARRNGRSIESNNSIEMMSLNVPTVLSPLAR